MGGLSFSRADLSFYPLIRLPTYGILLTLIFHKHVFLVPSNQLKDFTRPQFVRPPMDPTMCRHDPLRWPFLMMFLKTLTQRLLIQPLTPIPACIR